MRDECRNTGTQEGKRNSAVGDSAFFRYFVWHVILMGKESRNVGTEVALSLPSSVNVKALDGVSVKRHCGRGLSVSAARFTAHAEAIWTRRKSDKAQTA